MRKVPLSKKYNIYISKEHSFGTDAVLLANFAADKKKNLKACDMGTGCGIIPMLLIKDGAAKEVLGLEIQPKACNQAEMSISENGLGQSVRIINADIKDLPKEVNKGYYDLVTCNPPYKAEGSGIKSKLSADIIARHETECTLSDVCLAAKSLLKFGGRLCICQRPERLADIICEFRENGLEVKRVRFVSQRVSSAPWLVLVEGRLGGKAGTTVLPTLYLEQDGKLSDEMIEIYGDYKEGHGNGI